MKIEVSFFGKTQDGEEVKKYKLINEYGYSVSILNYGGIINEINVPDKEGNISNIVLGYNCVDDYENNTTYFGCITGRTAGRTSNATFAIDGVSYKLAQNNGENNLHGGVKGFNRVIWMTTEIVENDYIGLALNYMSPHLEEGYPGNLDTIVTYKWNNENKLIISYVATTDKDTPIILTNHSYFNLSGDLSTNILEHELQINADQFIKIKKDSLPYEITQVDKTPFDFRLLKKIGQDIDSDHEQIINGRGYDHPFILNNSKTPQITLIDRKSGRKLTIQTDEKCVVCYSGNYLTSDMFIYDKIPTQHRGGICLETQYYPDSLNFEAVPSRILKPLETYKQVTSYQFSISH